MSQKLVLSPATQKFVRTVEVGSPSTADQYGKRLYNFGEFLTQKYKISIDVYIQSYKQFDVYDVLFEYHLFLSKLNLQPSTIASRLRTAKTFLEFHDIPIVESKFRIKVRTPKNSANEEITALTKPLVNKIIIGCQTPRLHTYVLTLAATGARATETLSILTMHVDLEQGTIYLRKEWTKQKRARTVSLTKECLDQLKVWKEYRERKRRIVDKNGRAIYVTKPLKPTDLFFSSGRRDTEQDPDYLYDVLSKEFGQVLDRIGLDARDSESKRHEITLHSFRRWVYTTIEKLGDIEFANYMIGHANSTYWRETPEDRVKAFKKFEPYLTYLSYEELVAKGADIETKLEQKDKELQSVKDQLAELSKKLYQAGILKKD
ncbi:MAG: tyrosine-type recombinase/integrase [Candidatus Nitrosopolaris sp.]